METTEAIVAANVRRFRDARRHSVRSLSARLGELGRPILPSGITKIEDGSRRVDVGDLVALAEALDVSPVMLLMPPEPVDVRRWRWMHGELPLSREVDQVAFRRENRPYEDTSPAREIADFAARLVRAPFHLEVDSDGASARAKLSLDSETQHGDG